MQARGRYDVLITNIIYPANVIDRLNDYKYRNSQNYGDKLYRYEHEIYRYLIYELSMDQYVILKYQINHTVFYFDDIDTFKSVYSASNNNTLYPYQKCISESSINILQYLIDNNPYNINDTSIVNYVCENYRSIFEQRQYYHDIAFVHHDNEQIDVIKLLFERVIIEPRYRMNIMIDSTLNVCKFILHNYFKNTREYVSSIVSIIAYEKIDHEVFDVIEYNNFKLLWDTRPFMFMDEDVIQLYEKFIINGTLKHGMRIIPILCQHPAIIKKYITDSVNS